MTQEKEIAVVLSGCGFQDGAEIHEAVSTLLALDKAGAKYACFAPDIEQKKVVDHYNGKEMTEKRNVLIESARIARGDIKPLGKFNAADFDAIVFPGGFGVATSLCTFALDGLDMAVNEEAKKVILDMKKLNKPIGALCISPVLIARIIEGAKVTIGDNADVADAVTKMGAAHENTGMGQVVVDHENKIVTTPCYMLDSSIYEVYQGVENLVSELLKMI